MEKDARVFNIIPMSTLTFTLLIVFCLAILAIVAVPVFMEGFSWQATIVSVFVFIGVSVLLLSFGYQGKQATFSLKASGLTIRPGIYSRTIPQEDIKLEGVRVIDMNYERGYQPRWRMNGAGLPGYLAGWFKLQNGEKALMFVTNRSNVVYIPTNKNYSVLLSVQQADEMVSQLQKWD